MDTPLDDENQTSRLGVLGLGAMGEPMARRLLAAHGSLTVHARTRRPDLIAAGATWATTPRELAATSDAILVMLPDLPELEAALAGVDGLLAGAGDLLLLIGSTSSPTGVRDLAARLDADAAGRIRVVDCPVSGGVDGATAGTLSIMLGGTDADAARAAALLAPCGTPVYLGPLGAGEVAKACNQLVVSATITALGEASELAARSGIDLDVLWTLLGSGYAGSNLLASRKDKLVAGDDSPSGMAKYMVKDLRFASDVAQATGIRPALLPALRGIFDEIVAAGLGDRSDRAQDRTERDPRLVGAAGHERRAVERALLAAGDTHADEVEARLADGLLAADRVGEQAVAAVDDDVARLEDLHQRVDDGIGRATGLDHDDRRARLLQVRGELLIRERGHEFGLRVLGEQLVGLRTRPVEHSDRVPLARREVAGEVRTHDGESDDSDIGGGLGGLLRHVELL